LLAAAGVAMTPGVAGAQALAPVALPAPRSDFGRSLGQSLRMRRSQRDFSSRPLPKQVLSELLWSAYGVNRPDTKDRTAPSWRHERETEIYAAMETGTWRYDPVAHQLLPQLAGDIRAQTGVQDFVTVAPLTLIYVSDATHMSGVAPQEQHRFAAADTGFIGQNVYLYCASELLACVFRGSLDAEQLSRTLKLAETQFIQFAQTIGYPRG
jgi:hypothetical protein